MGKTVISIGLSRKSIEKAISQINEYKQGLQIKCDRLVSILADRGIAVAQMNVQEYGQAIVFTKKVKMVDDGAELNLAMCKTADILRFWVIQDGTVKSALVNPILMAEFGSGIYADNIRGSVVGAGRGTFPNQIHAFENGWRWQSLDGEWHYSQGETPKRPLEFAYLEMFTIIRNVAIEVFGNG